MDKVKECPPVKAALINLRGLVEQFGDSNDANSLNILEHGFESRPSVPLEEVEKAVRDLYSYISEEKRKEL